MAPTSPPFAPLALVPIAKEDALNPNTKPETLNPEPSTLNPQAHILNQHSEPETSSLNPKTQIPNPQPSTRNPTEMPHLHRGASTKMPQRSLKPPPPLPKPDSNFTRSSVKTPPAEAGGGGRRAEEDRVSPLARGADPVLEIDRPSSPEAHDLKHDIHVVVPGASLEPSSILKVKPVP